MNRKTALLLCGLAFFLAGAQVERDASSERKPSPAGGGAEPFLAEQRGKVVVLLMGMNGCPNTPVATEVLARLSKDCPDDVAFARLDVPLPETSVQQLADWPHDFFYAVDSGRAVARRLEFFYYPTLYVLDRDGEVRYAGGCDEPKLKTMMSEIRSEKPGSTKKFYTPPLPAVGTPAAGFTAKNLQGERVDFRNFQKKGVTLLFFTSVGCPFSVKAAKKLPDLETEFEDEGALFVLIEKGRSAEDVKALYEGIAVRGSVVLDADGAISQKYSVEPVPFYFVIKADGKIAARGPYTEDSARQALRTALGIKAAASSLVPSTGAG